VACFMTAIALFPVRTDASSVYTITDLGTLPGTSYSIATGINDSGQIVGYSYNVTNNGLGPNTDVQFFLYSNGRMTPITPLGGGVPTAINNSGQVVGGKYSSINDSGQTVEPGAPFQVMNPRMEPGAPAQTQFTPVGINNAGQFAGYINEYQANGQDAAIYKNGQVLDIAKAAGISATNTSQAVAIDKAGDVLMQAYNPKTGNGTYLVYKADGTTQTLPGGGITAAGLNSLGQVIGFTGYGGFLEQGGTNLPLMTLITPSSQSLWKGLDPTAINDEGQIVGGGGASDGNGHAFLMTPLATPEPSALMLMATAIVSFLLRAWSRRPQLRRS
jgi:probable HAF family extracellular repeat protein